MIFFKNSKASFASLPSTLPGSCKNLSSHLSKVRKAPRVFAKRGSLTAAAFFAGIASFKKAINDLVRRSFVRIPFSKSPTLNIVAIFFGRKGTFFESNHCEEKDFLFGLH